MLPPLKQFIFRILLLSVIIGAIGYVLFYTVLEDYYLPVFPFLLLFFIILNTVIHAIILKISQQNIARFTRNFMLSSSVKLLIYFVAILLYLLFSKENRLSFIVTFLVLYICYTAFEVMAVLPHVKRNQ